MVPISVLLIRCTVSVASGLLRCQSDLHISGFDELVPMAASGTMCWDLTRHYHFQCVISIVHVAH